MTTPLIVRAVATLASLCTTLALFQGVSSLASPDHAPHDLHVAAAASSTITAR